MNFYNKLSLNYDQLFLKNLNHFQNNWLSSGNGKAKFEFFYPSFGIRKKEKCDFLIYGQAANGWGSKFMASEEKLSNANVKNGIEYSNDYFVQGKHSPLDWVNIYWSKNSYKDEIVKSNDAKEFYKKNYEYSAYRSFFWNVCYKLISDYYDDLDRESWEWSKRMVWSNLYKIAPHQSNPNEYEQEMQRELCIELVKREIEELNPKYCIVLTNESWWLPFRAKINTIQLKHKSYPEVTSVELYKETKIILTKRPRVGGGEKHVSQILKLIKPRK